MDISRFYIKHGKANSGKLSSMDMHWKTCLRDIYFGFKAENSEDIIIENGFEYYEGADAYKFLLEVVCGLRSPMVGETEVFGQFKNYVDSVTVNCTDGSAVKKILIDIRNASKKVRSEHLINLGAQSYGSLLRKKINFADHIHIIGAGQFVEDIAPWISKRSKEIYVHSRNINKAKAKEALSELKHRELGAHTIETGTLIIAAPLTGEEIEKLIKDSHRLAIYDLRGNSGFDSFKTKSLVVSLKAFFKQIENNKSKIEKKVSQANLMIQSILENKLKEQKLNPFGWDDICA